MSRPSIPAEYTKPDFLSPSILKVTVLPLADFFVQLSIISSPLNWSQVSRNRGTDSHAFRHSGRSRLIELHGITCAAITGLLPIDGSMDYGKLFDSLKDALWGPSSPRGSQR